MQLSTLASCTSASVSDLVILNAPASPSPSASTGTINSALNVPATAPSLLSQPVLLSGVAAGGVVGVLVLAALGILVEGARRRHHRLHLEWRSASARYAAQRAKLRQRGVTAVPTGAPSPEPTLRAAIRDEFKSWFRKEQQPARMPSLVPTSRTSVAPGSSMPFEPDFTTASPLHASHDAAQALTTRRATMSPMAKGAVMSKGSSRRLVLEDTAAYAPESTLQDAKHARESSGRDSLAAPTSMENPLMASQQRSPPLAGARQSIISGSRQREAFSPTARIGGDVTLALAPAARRMLVAPVQSRSRRNLTPASPSAQRSPKGFTSIAQDDD